MRSQIGLQGRRALSFKVWRPDFSKLKIIAQPLGHVVGGPNEAFVPPPLDHMHGSYHWSYEKVTTVAMVPLMMTPFVMGVHLPLVDSLFSTLLLVHCKAGFQSCIIDYIPKRVYGIWHSVAMRLLDLGTFLGMYGVYLLETDSNGLFDFVTKMFSA